MQLLRYLTAGLCRQERVAFLGSPDHRVETVSAALREAGVDVTALVASGQLVLGSAEAAYLGGGLFDPELRLREYAEVVDAAVDEGFQGYRVAAEVDWVASRPDARTSWAGYELGAGLLAASLPFTALCVYDPQHWCPTDLAVLESVHAHRIRRVVGDVDTGFGVHAGPDGSLRLSGEVDMAFAGQLGEILTAALRYSAPAVLDVSELTFADLAGLRAIALAGRAVARGGRTATIRGASATFRRHWQLAAFDQTYPAIVVS